MERKVKRAAIVSCSTAAEGGRERRERERERESVCVCVLAPCELLEHWEKRDENRRKVGKTRRKGTTEALLASCSRCCVQAYIVQIYLLTV